MPVKLILSLLVIVLLIYPSAISQLSQRVFDATFSPIFTYLIVGLVIWAFHAKCRALLVSTRNWLADCFSCVMESPFPFGLFRFVANAANLNVPTYGQLIEWLSTRRDALSLRIPDIITNSTNAFMEWLPSQLSPPFRWVADVVNGPTLRGVMESLPSFRLSALPGLQWATRLLFDTDNPGAIPHSPAENV
ncbi:hypothetical protein BC827DRAFT_416010 [Russula dissimulans]|nr:hypothetical protein BC827DRAFT_416010 [Russula dissimulans]